VGLLLSCIFNQPQGACLQSSIEYTAADQVLIKKVKELFDRIHSRRQLIRFVGVRFRDLIAGTYHIDLFSETQEMIKLYQAIDSIKKQYGEEYLINAGGYRQKK
jgi:DNA polymerase IV